MVAVRPHADVRCERQTRVRQCHATADPQSAVVTFLVAASGITVLGIGGAFWALVVGVALRSILVRHRATA